MILDTKIKIVKIITIAGLCVLSVILIMKLAGRKVSDWWFIVNSICLLIAGVMIKNYEQAKKESDRSGD